MFERALPVLSLPLLALVACSAGAEPMESASSTGEPIMVAPPGGPITQVISVANISASPTDTSILIQFTSMNTAALTVALAGSDGSRASLVGSSAVLFQGLAPCTSYTYTFLNAGSALASGQVNTRLTGTTVCPASEKILATTVHKFRGVNHQQPGTAGCGGGTFPSYPLGTGWRYREDTIGVTTANVGAYFFNDPGTKPIACWEMLNDVSRARFDFTLSPLQLRRLKDASFTANYANEYGSNACATFNEQVNVMDATVPPSTYTATSANGNTWMTALGAPLTNEFLQQPGTAGPQQLVIASGGLMTIDFGQLYQPTLQVGLRQNLDGLDLVNNVFSQPSASCTATLSNAGLVLTYNDLPPETPTSCSMAINCNDATVTCNNTPDSFTLYRVTSAVGVPTVTTAVQTVQGNAAGGAITLSDTIGSWGYQVCTKTHAGDAASACTNISSITSTVACPPPPPSSGSGGTTGGGVGGTGSGYLPPAPPGKHTQT